VQDWGQVCRFQGKNGSCSLSVELPCFHQAGLQEGRTGAPIALSLEHLQPIHLAFDLPLTAGKQERIFHCFPIRT
jgi:hypothetical protein